MHGLYTYTEPLFMLLLVLATTAALFKGVFRADRETLAFSWKLAAGIGSGLISVIVWYLMYTWTYLSW